MNQQTDLRLRLVLVLFFLIEGVAYSQAQNWPIDPQTSIPTSISLLNGDYDGSQGQADGLRIEAPIGTVVKSVAAGSVSFFGTGSDWIIIADSPGDETGWLYGHINPDPSVSVMGAAVTAGQIVGTTDGTSPTDDPSFVHFIFGRRYTYDPNGLGNHISYQNPLLFYSSLPSMAINLTSNNIQFVQDFDPTNSSANIIPFTSLSNGETIIYGSIDSIVDPHTNTQGDPKPGINSLGFYIINGPPGSVSIAERTMFDFSNFGQGDTEHLNLVYAPSSNYFDGKYIVTNCGPANNLGTDGAANIIKNAWYSKVLSGVDDTQGGISSSQFGILNSQAKYPDGQYDFVVHAKTFNATDDKAVTVQTIVDNFFPYLQNVVVLQTGSGSPQYAAAWSNTPQSSTVLGTSPIISQNSPLSTSSTATIRLTFSEAMDTSVQPIVQLVFDNGIQTITGGWQNQGTSVGSIWEADGVGVPIPNCSSSVTISVSGTKDLAGNFINPIPRNIPSRDGSGNWTNFSSGPDMNFTFLVGIVNCTPTNTPTNVPLSSTPTFTNTSIPTNTPTGTLTPLTDTPTSSIDPTDTPTDTPTGTITPPTNTSTPTITTTPGNQLACFYSKDSSYAKVTDTYFPGTTLGQIVDPNLVSTNPVPYLIYCPCSGCGGCSRWNLATLSGPPIITAGPYSFRGHFTVPANASAVTVSVSESAGGGNDISILINGAPYPGSFVYDFSTNQVEGNPSSTIHLSPGDNVVTFDDNFDGGQNSLFEISWSICESWLGEPLPPSPTPTVTSTFTATPTFTPTPTFTFTPTSTFTFTNTFTNTSTFTPSFTPTFTFTDTPTPITWFDTFPTPGPIPTTYAVYDTGGGVDNNYGTYMGIVSGTISGSPNNSLQVSSTSTSSAPNYSVVLGNSSFTSNYTVESDVNLGPNQVSQGQFGLLFRAQNGSSYYSFVWDSSSNNWEFLKASGGTPSVMSSAPAPAYPINTLVHMKVVCQGTQFQCYVNLNDCQGDRLVLNNSDSSFATGNAGMQGGNVPTPDAINFQNFHVTQGAVPTATPCQPTSTPIPLNCIQVNSISTFVNAIALDTTGNLFIEMNGRKVGEPKPPHWEYFGPTFVEILNPNGQMVTQWDPTNSNGSTIVQFGSLAVGNNGLIYLTDQTDNAILAFNESGNRQYQWGQIDNGQIQFNNPNGIAINSSSTTIYIADTFNRQVEMIGPTGNYFGKWGSLGNAGFGSFEAPLGVAVDSSGKVYITDGTTGLIQVFDYKGQFLNQWSVAQGRTAGTIGVGNGQVYVEDNSGVEAFSLDGNYFGTFSAPATFHNCPPDPVAVGNGVWYQTVCGAGILEHYSCNLPTITPTPTNQTSTFTPTKTLSPTITPTPTISPTLTLTPTPISWRIDCGSLNPYLDNNSHLWLADQSFTGYSTPFSNAKPVNGTSDPTLYQTARFSTSASVPITYTFAVTPNIPYQATLKFDNLNNYTICQGTCITNNYPVTITLNGSSTNSIQSFAVILEATSASNSSIPVDQAFDNIVADSNGNITILVYGFINAIQLIPESQVPSPTPTPNPTFPNCVLSCYCQELWAKNPNAVCALGLAAIQPITTPPPGEYGLPMLSISVPIGGILTPGLVLPGGFGTYHNGVWFTPDGANWTKLNSAANFSPRGGHAGVVFNNQMWLMGGYDGTNYLNDLWTSSEGVTWTPVTNPVLNSGRTGHSMAVFNPSTGPAQGNRIWIIGGQSGTNTFNSDVWYSDSSGTQWNNATANAGFTARTHQGCVVFNNQLWVIGGQDANGPQNDVWNSLDGFTWQSVPQVVPFTSRSGMACFVQGGNIYVLGGKGITGELNDAWFSSDAQHWRQIVGAPGFAPREQLAYAVSNNQVWLFGGYDGANDLGDMWSTQLMGTVTPSPTPTITPTPVLGICQPANFWTVPAPSGIAFDKQGNSYVTSFNNNQVNVYSPAGGAITQWNQSPGSGPLSGPLGLVVDTNSLVYVTDSNNNRVVVFDKNGNYIRQWGQQGSQNGQFITPTGIAVNASATTVYVGDLNNSRVQFFDIQGNYLGQWGSPDFEIGNGGGTFNYINGLAVDSNGLVYVADYNTNLVQVFDNRGNFIRQWDVTQGTGLIAANWVAVSNDGHVYVTDGANGVGIFNPDGTPIETVTGGNLTFIDTEGIAVGPGYWTMEDGGPALEQMFASCFFGVQPTSTHSMTPTVTATNTFTNTPTSTATPTTTNSGTFTPTSTATSTSTNTPINTSTSSPTNTTTDTPTNTPTFTFTQTNSPTNTATNSPTYTFTTTNTATSTATNTPTFTYTLTNSPTNTPTRTSTTTSTFTKTNTPTITLTPTRTGTSTLTGTPTKTATVTPTSTKTKTPTITLTPTKTASFTVTSTSTNTASNTRTNSPTKTATNTTTPSFTPTFTPGSAATPTPANDLYAQWTEATNNPAFGQRVNYGAVTFGGQMWMMGGYNYNFSVDAFQDINDVWSSSNGSNWTEATAAAAFPARDSMGVVAFNNQIWVIGGENQNTPQAYNDVWFSSNGAIWTQATGTMPWSARYGFGCLVYNNEIWIIGGYDVNGNALEDVWNSSNGTTWNQVASSAAFGIRAYPGCAVLNGKMWVMGGEDGFGDTFNDVWYSTNGSTWTLGPSALWTPRTQMACMAYNGQLVVAAGWAQSDASYTYYNDVYHSPDGVNWTASTYAGSFGTRAAITGVVYNNQTWIFDGWNNDETYDDVWYAPPTPLPTLTPTNTPGGMHMKPGNVSQANSESDISVAIVTMTPTYSPSPTPVPQRGDLQVAAVPNISTGGQPIRFLANLSKPSQIRLSLFSLTGEQVYGFEVAWNQGLNSFPWNLQNNMGQSVASGLYIYTLEVMNGNSREVHKGKVVILH